MLRRLFIRVTFEMTTKRVATKSVRDLQVALAEYLIQTEKGQDLPSIRELSASSRMSVGSVSSALRELQRIGAVGIRRRGHLGSVVESVSLSVLWNLIGQRPLVVALSLPMHRRFEGLATGLKMALENAGIEAYLIFIRGSKTRLKALKENRCHVAVMSGLAADELCSKENEILLRLPAGSWISEYSVFYRSDAWKPGRLPRVAVDPDSFDQQRLTELEFAGEAVEFRASSFIQFSHLLKHGDVDAVIWNKDQEDSYFGPVISHRALSEKVTNLVGEKSTSAAFLARAGDESVRAILRGAVRPDEIMEIQRRVVAGEMIPQY